MYRSFFMLRSFFLMIIVVVIGYHSMCIFFPSLSHFSNQKIKLGLDIKGGSYIRLKLDHQYAMKEYLTNLRGEIESELYDAHITSVKVFLDDFEKKIIIQMNDIDSKKSINKIIKKLEKKFQIVSDKRTFALTPKGSFILEYSKDILHHTMENIRKRIDAIGTNESQISHQGLNYILVQVPGIDNPNKLKNMIGKNAKLALHFLADKNTPEKDILILKDNIGNKYKILKIPELSGDILKRTSLSYGKMGEPVVSFFMNTRSSERFAFITTNNLGKNLVVVLDDKVLTAPVIKEPIIGGKGEIKGSFSNDEASELAILLRSGSLPVPLIIEEEKMIGPTLGEDIIQYGIKSAIIALILITICMISVYRIFGMFAIIALFINVLIILCCISFFGITITLPSIAGLILTIGMSVDNNILIFERIKEIDIEYKDMEYAIKRGFSYAKSTIFDANITTMIAAFTMFILGVSTVKGFAIMLSIGILSSMFTSLNITFSLIHIWSYIKLKKYF